MKTNIMSTTHTQMYTCQNSCADNDSFAQLEVKISRVISFLLGDPEWIPSYELYTPKLWPVHYITQTPKKVHPVQLVGQHLWLYEWWCS